MFKSEHQRHFQRIALHADVVLSNRYGDQHRCQCIEISEDSVVLTLNRADTEFSIRTADIVQIRLETIADAPTLRAAVIKVSPERISLRLLAPQ